MFRNYLNNTNDDNGTENWSYPAGFERFNSVNIPRSRLGKRRTINTSSEVKRSILKGISSEHKSEKDEYKNLASKTSSLTHPVNSFSTPNYKKIDSSLDKSEENNENRDCDKNVNHLTPFRTIGSYPLKEINSEQNIIVSNEKPSQLVGPLLDQQLIDVKKIFNKSSEGEKTINSIEEGAHLHTDSTVNTGAALSDSSHSDFCNNSSFMTAHDVYNIEKNKDFQDYLKTPGKGYGLFDTVASPLESLSTNTDDETDSLRKFLVKTPALCHYDTPYRTQMRHDLFTPFKNKILTPINGKNLVNIPERNLECEHSDNQDCMSKLENGIRTECSIVSNSSSLKGSGSNTINKLVINKERNSPLSTPCHNFINEPLSMFKKPSQSVEKLVKRQIFEGLGWTVPHSTFIIQSPVKEAPSNLIQKNSDFEIRGNFIDSTLIKEERVVKSGLNILSEPCAEINSNGSQSNTNSFENSKGNEMQERSILSSIEKFPSAFNEEDRLSFKVDRSISKSIDSDVHNLINENLKELHTYTTKPVNGEADVINSNMKQTSVGGEIKELSIKDMLPNKECTVVLNQLETQTKEIIDNSECKDTVILKKSNRIEQKSDASCQEQLAEKKVTYCTQEKVIHETPLFPHCQTQIIQPPQANTIYVNKKPYTVLSMLGRGGSSEVYQVLDPSSSKLMALKFVNLSSVEDAVAKGYLNEIEVLSKLQGCPSVIKMFDSEYIMENKILYVLMEKGDTDFSRLMKDITKTKKISMAMIIYYWTEMLNAVKDIHDKGIIHSDLKPANFLLVSGRLKLIDFGIASSLQGDMTSVLKDVTTGTFNYMSPEAIRNSGETRGYKINYKSDIWSLGCILYNLLYGRTPFSHLTNTWTKLQAIADPDTAVSFPSTSTAPPHLLLSVRWALTKDPKERPTAEELLKLAELTPGPETQLGRQISSLLGEYILQMFPNCRVRFEIENPKDKKQGKVFLN